MFNSWLAAASVPLSELQHRGVPKEYKTCQNELVILGNVWTFGHPVFCEDGSKTFISGSAEGKGEILIFGLRIVF